MTADRDQRVELKTERLLLRPFKLEDVDGVFEYAKDPEWARYLLLRLPQPYTRRDAEEYVARQILAVWRASPTFAIVLGSRVIGGIHLDIQENGGIAALGYGLSRAHWGKGMVPEAAKAVIDWGFEEYGLAKVYVTADLRSQPSPEVSYPEKSADHRLDELEVEGLTYRFTDTGGGVENVSMRLKRGSFTVITGRIGAGKTTLLQALLGMLPSDAGEVRWNGDRVEDTRTFLVPPRCAYTPQVPRVFSDTLRNNILLGIPEEQVDLQGAIRSAVP